MVSHYDVVIVGGGHAGAQAALALRQAKMLGTIAILSAEALAPYERPALSKEYLAGEKTFERMLIKPLATWAERGVELLLGHQVVSVDARSRKLACADGTEIGYGDLIWAAGGSARRAICTGAELAGIHTVRTRPDVDRILAELPGVRDVVVIGGGYIGLEAAAALSKLGKTVTVIEALDRVLARVAAEPLSRFYEAEHRAHGVEILLNATVSAFVGEAGSVTAVQLDSGEHIPAQLVVVGIGIVPEVAPLIAAGAECANGIRVDEFCRTSVRNIYAIGDCAEHRSRFAAGNWIRLESVQNAHDQAKTAALAIVGDPAPYDAVPWFWSNQYDLKLQTVGLNRGYDEIVLRGTPGKTGFSVIYLRKGQVIALDCVNSVRDYVQGRELVVAGLSPCPDRMRDQTLTLKSIATM